MFMKLKPFEKGILKNAFAEFGLVHTPWLDFEQKINMSIKMLLDANFKKECPYCAEIIKSQAKKCMHCKEIL